MNFNEYQEFTRKTAVYPDQGGPLGLAYAGLGLGNEAGEAQGKIKKCFRGDYDTVELRELLKGELGDVAYYLARVADEVGLSFDEIIKHNVSKLLDRQARGVLKGNGDDR